jgi:hypothetical protein
MTYSAEERHLIADAVARARIAQGLTKEAAARRANTSSITWKRVEDALGVQDGSVGKIVASLGLPDVADLLHGGRAFDAAQLSNDELLAELRRRLDLAANRPDQLKHSGVPMPPAWRSAGEDARVFRDDDGSQGNQRGSG